MGKRSDTVETVVLALELLKRIPRHGRVSAAELHRQLSDAGIPRDLRTIQRQLELLSAHFQIERDARSRPYGYRWAPQAGALVVPELSAQQSLLIRLAEEHLRNLLPPKLMRSMSGYFDQARKDLAPGGRRPREREWTEKVRVVATSQPLLPPQVDPTVFEETCEALYRNLWLQIDYRNASGRRAAAQVMPLGLAQQGPRLYLVCRFEGYDDDRSIALHRMQSARATTLGFERPADFDLKRYDDEGRFGFGDGRRVRLRFRITCVHGMHLLETPLSADQMVVEVDGGYEVTATVVDSDMLEWWLRGFGDAVTDVRRSAVTAPASRSGQAPRSAAASTGRRPAKR